MCKIELVDSAFAQIIVIESRREFLRRPNLFFPAIIDYIVPNLARHVIVWFPNPLAAGSQMGTLSRWPREMQWDKSERNTSEKSTFQTSPNWRTNLPRLEDVLFQGLGAWRIIFFYFRKHFPKIHARQIPKMSDFYVFGPFLAEKTAVKEKKARFDPFVPPTHFQQQVGWGTRLGTD